jgi:hypothetical protein
MESICRLILEELDQGANACRTSREQFDATGQTEVQREVGYSQLIDSRTNLLLELGWRSPHHAGGQVRCFFGRDAHSFRGFERNRFGLSRLLGDKNRRAGTDFDRVGRPARIRGQPPQRLDLG